MKKIFTKIIIFLCFFSIFAIETSYAELKITTKFSESKDYLWELWKGEEQFIKTEGDKGLIIWIANSLVNVFFIIASIYFFILVLRLIFSENAEEEHNNFKKWFLWISIWLMIMVSAKAFVNSIYREQGITETKDIWTGNISNIADDLINNIITPFTNLLETWASILFILIAIYAFFKLATANGDEEKAKTWKWMVIYSIFAIILIKASSVLVEATFWKCEKSTLWFILNYSCERQPNVWEWIWIITTIINWINSFIWIWIVIMIVYVWLQLIFSNWNEDKINSWKKSLIYIFIWVWILVVNYIILTFFLTKDAQLIS